MKRIAYFTLAFCALALFSATTVFAMNKKEVETIIKEYIKEHPEVIIETLHEYELSQSKRESESALKQSLAQKFEVELEGSPSIGPANAQITLVEFSDFQCPFCARASGTVGELMKKYSGNIRVVFKNLPLPMHARAVDAAKAAMAAEAQGKFWEYKERLMNSQGQWSSTPALKETFVIYAKELNMDVSRFEKDLGNPAFQKRIDADMAQARKLGLNSTPNFFINGHRINGARDMGHFEKVIAASLGDAKKKK